MEKTTYQAAEIEIHYKPNFKAFQRPLVDSSFKAYKILLSGWDVGRLEYLEEFKVLLLNRANRVLGIINISQGGIAGTIVDPKIIFATALKSAASGIILAHNHPSGNHLPSPEDFQITKKIVEIGQLLELPILDHIILCSDHYYSFQDEGRI